MKYKQEKRVRSVVYFSKDDKKIVADLVKKYEKTQFEHISASRIISLALHHFMMHQKMAGKQFNFQQENEVTSWFKKDGDDI